MKPKGYCYAYRSAWTHPAFNDLREAAIWNFLYQNAFWEDGVRNFNGSTFNLKRGQIVVSIRFLAQGFGISEKGARGVIQKLEKLGMVVKQGASKGTVITICNYDTYQIKQKTKGEQKSNRGANKGRATDANNNDGNEGKEVNEGNTKKTKAKKPKNISNDVWEDFTELRKAKKAPITETAIKRIESQAQKINWSLEQALVECCNRGWTGFNHEWILNSKGNGNNGQLTKSQRADIAAAEAVHELQQAEGDRDDGSGELRHISSLREGA